MHPETIGRYRILRQLGAGGMGEVYLGEDPALNRLVAIKVLRAESGTDRTADARLVQEAQAAATLDHTNVCAIYEVGEDAGQHFIAMQYVEGETLADRLARGPCQWQTRCASPHRWPTRSRKRTRAASSIVTSSPATSCSRPAGRRRCSTSVLPSASIVRTCRPPAWTRSSGSPPRASQSGRPPTCRRSSFALKSPTRARMSSASVAYCARWSVAVTRSRVRAPPRPSPRC